MWMVTIRKKKIQENTQGRLKRWFLYHLGVSNKFNQDKYRCISDDLGFRPIVHSFIQTKGVENLSISVHAFVIVTHLTLFT